MSYPTIYESAINFTDRIAKDLASKCEENQIISKISLKSFYQIPHNQSTIVFEMLKAKGFIVELRNIVIPSKKLLHASLSPPASSVSKEIAEDP